MKYKVSDLPGSLIDFRTRSASFNPFKTRILTRYVLKNEVLNWLIENNIRYSSRVVARKSTVILEIADENDSILFKLRWL